MSETFVDVTAELLAYVLHLSEHNIGIDGARTMPHGVIRLYLRGDGLPDGQVKITYERRVEQTNIVTLNAIEPV